MPNFLETLMQSLGHSMLVPSIEEDPESVWVTDDRAPGGAAGYFKKIHVPATHRTITDGRVVIFRFTLDAIEYEIRCRHLDTAADNLEEIIIIAKTIERWIADGICDRAAAYLPFRRNVETEDRQWFHVLRVAPDATNGEVQEAYRKQALIRHPDRGGSHDAFRELREAYETALRRR